VSDVAVRGEAAEVARAEAQAVMAMLEDGERRGRLADLVAAVAEGRVREADAEALGELLDLGLRTGRLRALYGPGGEQAARALYRRLPIGRGLAEATRALNAALEGLEGREVERVQVHSLGPGEYGLSIVADGFEIGLHLGPSGPRVTTIGA
jgi:hypothetical protein